MSKKYTKETFERKGRILAPGDRKNIKKPLATGTSASLGATSRFWDPKIEKVTFGTIFTPKVHFPLNSVKSAFFAPARATAANPL